MGQSIFTSIFVETTSKVHQFIHQGTYELATTAS